MKNNNFKEFSFDPLETASQEFDFIFTDMNKLAEKLVDFPPESVAATLCVIANTYCEKNPDISADKFYSGLVSTLLYSMKFIDKEVK